MKVEELTTKLNNLKPSLINAFTKYYGEEYREKITTKLNETTFIYIDNDYNYVGTTNESRIQNDAALLEKIKNITEITDITACTMQKTYPPVIVIKEKFTNNLNVLVHEINHTLHNAIIGEIEQKSEFTIDLISQFLPQKKEFIYQEGITNEDTIIDDSYDNYFYETLNEYMTRDILELLKQEKIDDFFTINLEKLDYLTYDKALHNIIFKTYKLMEQIIKYNLINANGQIIRNIIGKDNYQIINQYLKKIETIYEKFVINQLKNNETKTLEEIKNSIEDQFIKSFTEKQKNDLETIYNKYYYYIVNNLNSYNNSLQELIETIDKKY